MIFEFLDVNYNDCPADQAPVRFGFECPKSTTGFICSGLVIRDNPSGINPPNRTWTWNGNRVAPTFSPSIDCKGCSHGFIVDGVWTDA